MKSFDPQGAGRRAFLRLKDDYLTRWQARLQAADLPTEWTALATELADGGKDRTAFELCLLVMLQEHEGSTRLPLAELDEAYGRLGGPKTQNVQAESVTDTPSFVVDGSFVYSRRMQALEMQVAEQLNRRLAQAPLFSEAEVRKAWTQQATEPRPAPAQEAAILQAAQRSFYVVTGGPGTGKTTVVGHLLRLMRTLRPDARIALAAPTGRAAHRLGTSASQAMTNVEAQTLHRLLGYAPSQHRFRRHANDPVEADLVVVDEASMIDMWLMTHLLDAVAPTTQLVLLGDADQLPSVDAGQILKDLSERKDCTGVLQENFRMRDDRPGGKHLLRCADLVRKGADELFDALGEGPEGIGARWLELSDADARSLCFEFDDRARSPDNERFLAFRSQANFREDHANRIHRLLTAQGSAKIMCLNRSVGRLRSVDGVNRALHGRRVRQMSLIDAPHLLPGEPVVVTANDYERQLFNGDQGCILKVAQDQEAARPFAVFARDDELIAYPLAELAPRLALAHASTVHRAQGSEYEHVLILLPEQPSSLCTREILYTALTRAKTSATIVGPREVLQACLQNESRRSSGLKERLQ